MNLRCKLDTIVIAAPYALLSLGNPHHPRRPAGGHIAWGPFGSEAPDGSTLRFVAPPEGDRPAVLPATPYRAYEGSLRPLEVQLFADAADGRLHRFSLLSAALIASGIDRPQT